MDNTTHRIDKHVGWSVSGQSLSDEIKTWHIGKLPKREKYSIYCEIHNKKLNVYELVPIAWLNKNELTEEFIDMFSNIIECIANPSTVSEMKYMLGEPVKKEPKESREENRSLYAAGYYSREKNEYEMVAGPTPNLGDLYNTIHYESNIIYDCPSDRCLRVVELVDVHNNGCSDVAYKVLYEYASGRPVSIEKAKGMLGEPIKKKVEESAVPPKCQWVVCSGCGARNKDSIDVPLYVPEGWRCSIQDNGSVFLNCPDCQPKLEHK